ncbi:MAG: thioredoxin family protein [Planctomycetales bacterium]|nr:thioredoxin family protein [Planctomycetales bacterium]
MKNVFYRYLQTTLVALCSWFVFATVVVGDPTEGEKTASDAVVKDENATPAVHANWITSMDEAQKVAAEKRKTILMDFTGSDWCGWCIKLSEEVFNTPEFKSWADEHLVLVELDFPNDQSKITEEGKAHNDQWLKKLKVAGFPTIYLTDHEGRPYAKTGYKEGGPDEYIKHLTQLLQIRMLRDTAMKLAGEAEGNEKARFLDDALSTMDAQIVGLHYTDEIEQLKQIGGEALLQKYAQLAENAQGGAESVGMVREDWMADPFGFLSMDMKDASDHLDIADTEPPVEEYHPRIEDRLAKLIELMNKT